MKSPSGPATLLFPTRRAGLKIAVQRVKAEYNSVSSLRKQNQFHNDCGMNAMNQNGNNL
jgi:hypothetical protein